jgi:hypothetical protein
MPFRDPTRVLILPPGAVPPTPGQSIIVINPGPPPVIQLYTGDSDERTPADIRANVSGGNPQLNLTGPDIIASTLGPASITLGMSSPVNGESFIEAFAGDFAFYDGGGTPLLKLHGTESFISPYSPFAELIKFKSNSTDMQDKFDVNGTDVNALVNTTYATPTGQLCGVAFVAPPSGRGLVTWHMRADFNFSGAAALSRSVRACAVLRNGSTIGAGTDPNLAEGQATPNDDIGCGHAITHPTGTGSIGGPAQHGLFHVSGLTPGNDYNVFLQAKCNSATTFTYDVLFQKVGWTPLY